MVLISKVDCATEKAKAVGVQTDFRSYQLAIETVARENAGLSTLVDDGASGEEKYAALEAALNKNLDPKLRVEFDADGNISTEAKDPWKEQYLGEYLAPDADGTVKDRGAIVMYCKGSNLKLGSTSETVNGVVNVTVKSGKEVEGADDYSISTVYTYVSGYGEIKTTIGGFSNDVSADGNDQGSNTPTTPSDPSDSTDPDDSIEGGSGEEIEYPAAGLYETGSNYTVIITPWDLLMIYGDIGVEDGVITYCDCYTEGDLVLPNDGSVVGIGYGAFQCCESLTSIKIPDDVISIDDSAFEYCSSLTSIEIPRGVSRIGDYMFANCFDLINITIGNSVESVGECAFFCCTSLTSITIPKGVKIIDNDVFFSCDNLTIYCEVSSKPNGWDEYWNPDNRPVVWGDAEPPMVEQRLEYALKDDGTYEVVGIGTYTDPDVIIPDEVDGIRVTSIGFGAFIDCALMESVAITSNITSIDACAFQDCNNLIAVYITNLTAWINIDFDDASSQPLDHAHNLYLNGELITELIIPNDVTTIGNYTFYECSSLTNITISNSVTTIGKSAFECCYGLTGELKIPDNVTSIDDWAFSNCTGIEDITIGNCVTNIGIGVFEGCTGITNIAIPDNITSIGEQMFYKCSGLTSVTFGENSQLTNINKNAFGCSGLESIVIPSGVKNIDAQAFIECGSLTTINIPDGVVNIGDRAFSDCSGLTGDLIIPNSVTNIGDGSFNGCYITSVDIGSGVISIGKSPFSSCSNLTSITVDDANPIYHDGGNCIIETSTGTLIQGCKNSIIPIDGSITIIGNSAFKGCRLTGELVIPDVVTSIEYGAFNMCTGITSVIIPDSVTNIDGWAFNYCTVLTSITIEATVPPTINQDTFKNCIRLVDIFVPESSVETYKAADGWIDFADKIQAVPTT